MLKKIFYINIRITASLYLAVYLIRVFIMWSFPNPFDWMIAMPTYEPHERFFILFFWLFYEGCLWFIVYQHLNDKAKKAAEAKS